MKFVALIVGLFGLFCSKAAIAETSEWKTVGWWDILFLPSTGGCTAFATYDKGVMVGIGLASAEELQMHVILMNDDWKSIEEGKEYEINVKFGNETPWRLEMNGFQTQSSYGLDLTLPAATDQSGVFAKEFMRETGMEWHYEGRSLGDFSLKGSRLAFQEVVACTKSYRSALQTSADPFASSSSSSDPFE